MTRKDKKHYRIKPWPERSSLERNRATLWRVADGSYQLPYITVLTWKATTCKNCLKRRGKIRRG